jgi:hypothetical protein
MECVRENRMPPPPSSSMPMMMPSRIIRQTEMNEVMCIQYQNMSRGTDANDGDASSTTNTSTSTIGSIFCTSVLSVINNEKL